MTKFIKNTVLGVVAVGLVVSSANAAAMTVNPGDLVLTVYQYLGGEDYGTMTYNVNLGGAYDFNSMNPADSLANIGADLTATFGAGWATDTTLRFVLLGGLAGTASGNDPARTAYVGSALSESLGSSSQAGVSAGTYVGFTTNVNTYTTMLNDSTMSYTDTIANFPFSSAYAGMVGEVFDDGSDFVVAFDLYRYTGRSGPPPAMNAPTNLGTLSINKNGDIGWNVVAVPEPSTFALLGLSFAAACVLRRRMKK